MQTLARPVQWFLYRVARAASELFYQRGIRAIGVDGVVAAAGVAKVSLYRAFPSKDDLITAYLEEQDAHFWKGWDEAIASSRSAKPPLQVIIDHLIKGLLAPEYRGCPFANFTAEFAEADHPGHAVVRRSKEELRSRITGLCQATAMDKPDDVANALTLMLEGAFALSQSATGGQKGAATALRAAAAFVLGR